MKVRRWTLLLLLGGLFVWGGKTLFLPEEGWLVAPGAMLIVLGLLDLLFGEE